MQILKLAMMNPLSDRFELEVVNKPIENRCLSGYGQPTKAMKQSTILQDSCDIQYFLDVCMCVCVFTCDTDFLPPQVDYSEARFNEIVQKLKTFLKQIGFKVLFADCVCVERVCMQCVCV